MAAFVAYLGTLLLSLVVSLIATLQLGDFFGAGDELLLVLGWLGGFSLGTLVIFAVASRLGTHVRALNILAFILAILALLPPVVPGFVAKIAAHSANPYSVGVERTYIKLELVVPALLAVLVQWGLVRGRFMRSMGENDLTLWPWITTVIAGLIVLNPFGLTFLTAAIRRSPTELLWQPIAIGTAGALAALLVMAWVECYIRDRILSRRLPGSNDTFSADRP
jgi:hypothetical protein